MGRRGFQQLANGKWRWQGRDPVSGRRVSVTADTRIELEVRVRRIKHVRDDLKWGDLDPRQAAAALRPALGRSLTVDALWERYFKGLRPDGRDVARSTYERRIKPFLGDKVAWELTETVMREWVARLQADKFAPKTIRSAYDYLRACIRLAVDAGELRGWPWGSFKMGKARPRRERDAARNLEEFAALLIAARELDERDWKAGRYADRTCRFLVMGLTGLRQAEAAGLAWDCVELEASDLELVHVRYQAKRGWVKRWPDGRPQDKPKWYKERTLRLHSSVVVALMHQREQLQARGWYRLDGPVFPGLSGRFRTSGRAIKPECVRELARAAGFARPQDWTTHSLRHSFATLEVVASGGDLQATRARTGHSTIAQLEGYLHRAGRGMAPSRVPALPPELVPQPRSDAPPLPRAEVRVLSPGGALVDLMQATHERAASFEAARRDEKRRLRAEAERPFEELAREWLAAGEPPPRPKAVTLAVRRAYVRAYQQALREGGTKREAQAAGRRSQRACLGAWGQTLARARQATSTESA